MLRAYRIRSAKIDKFNDLTFDSELAWKGENQRNKNLKIMKLVPLLPLVYGRYGPGSADISAPSYGPGGAGRDKMLQCKRGLYWLNFHFLNRD